MLAPGLASPRGRDPARDYTFYTPPFGHKGSNGGLQDLRPPRTFGQVHDDARLRSLGGGRAVIRQGRVHAERRCPSGYLRGAADRNNTARSVVPPSKAVTLMDVAEDMEPGRPVQGRQGVLDPVRARSGTTALAEVQDALGRLMREQEVGALRQLKIPRRFGEWHANCPETAIHEILLAVQEDRRFHRGPICCVAEGVFKLSGGFVIAADHELRPVRQLHKPAGEVS
mmetsp:Transcript_77736/g.166675  ORF Transcript_77736/g.166675 Transcript_77736/m.166675 type:complete len:227 (+) Transcript_77736:53-733(+)